VSVRGTSLGQAIVNVFHVKWTGGNFNLPDITYVANLVKGVYETNIIPRLNGNYSGDNVRAVDLGVVTGQEATVALAGTPGATSTAMPQSAAACITWRIVRHYRGGHPRTYVGPLHPSHIESPTSLAATYITSLATSATAFLNGVNAGTTGGFTMKLVAVHRWQGKTELLVPLTSDIVGASVDSRIDTMRRRLGKDR
jgi:hypothetical protein